ncbi:hypothetical protein HDE_05994 [Halotydeus destructor]|nr:hypothetical protein HDE_05994 [Halotydeus destructor]
MNLSVTILFSAVALCVSISYPADDLDCDFSHGLCDYEVSPDSNVTINYDPEVNWSYVTIGSGSEASFHSLAIDTFDMQCFQYSLFFNATDEATIIFMQQLDQEDYVISQMVPSLAENFQWYNGTWQIEYVGEPFEVVVVLLRFNSTGNFGLTNLRATPGVC